MTQQTPAPFSLTINFRGICTHFHRHVLPGVLHRVVLPDASAFRAGLATTDPNDPLALAEYYLQPHIPTVHSTDASLDVPDLIYQGMLLSNVHLTVPNAVGHGVSYDGFEHAVSSVTSFTDNYAYSSDVVLAGRAAAYLDIQSGTIAAMGDRERVTHICATIPTSGPPILRVAPLAEYREKDLRRLSVDIEFRQSNSSMLLSNSCWTGHEEETNDYLLHLLTERGGIPRKVTHPAFEFVPQSRANASEMLRALLVDLGYPAAFNAAEGPPGTQQSCSDARYP